MYDNFKTANYPFALISPEMYGRHLHALFGSGIIDGFSVEASTGLTVTVRPGNALIGYGSGGGASARLVSLTDDFNLTHDAADLSNPRIDSIVLYVDNSVDLPPVDEDNPPTPANEDGPGVAKAVIVKGAPNANPVAPNASAIQSAIGSGNPYEVLSNDRIDSGASVLSQGNISDKRSYAGLGSKNIDYATIEYSTEERVIGKWIDGKLLYRKTIDCGALPNASSKVVPLSIAYDRVIKTEFTAQSGPGGTVLDLPFVRDNSAGTADITYVVRADGITITTFSNRSTMSGYCTLYYTKV